MKQLNIHHHDKRSIKINGLESNILHEHSSAWNDILGLKETFQLSLEPKNPSFNKKSKRGSENMSNLGPKTYASYSVKKCVKLWGLVSIYWGLKSLKNRYGRLGCESGCILLRKDWKMCALSSPKGRWAKAQKEKIRHF